MMIRIEFAVLLIVFCIEAFLMLAVTEGRKRHPENKRYAACSVTLVLFLILTFAIGFAMLGK